MSERSYHGALETKLKNSTVLKLTIYTLTFWSLSFKLCEVGTFLDWDGDTYVYIFFLIVHVKTLFLDLPRFKFDVPYTGFKHHIS